MIAIARRVRSKPRVLEHDVEGETERPGILAPDESWRCPAIERMFPAMDHNSCIWTGKISVGESKLHQVVDREFVRFAASMSDGEYRNAMLPEVLNWSS